MIKSEWNTTLYEQNHAFVWQYGESLLELLSPQVGEQILDLGCGTGQLTNKIAETGARVQGIDAAIAMIEKARQNYPHLQFSVADARCFSVNQPLDAIFSNAVLHWIHDVERVIACVYQSLKPGGRFVVEFGGKGNVNAILQGLDFAFHQIGYTSAQSVNFWYFPSIAEYATQLEQQGFDVTYAVLTDRPTPLEGGDAGMRNWLMMFANGLLSELSPHQQTQVIETLEKYLKPRLYQHGVWTADYRRLRVMAIKR